MKFASVHSTAMVFGGVLLAAVPGCGAATRGATFSGSEAPPRTEAYAVIHAPTLPAGFRSIGRVSAACHAVSSVSNLDGRRLSDVGCSQQRMILALEARAATAGGDALYALECRGHDVNDMERANVNCSARVARAEGAPPRDADAPAARMSAHKDDPTSLDAWAIRVAFAESPQYAARPVRHPELVVEEGTLPPSHVAFGDVTAECAMAADESVCDRDAVRAGLRVAAARVGASDLVGVRCFQGTDVFKCVGTAAGVREPAADPEAWR